MKVEHLEKPFGIEVKRFYIPVKLTSTCKCGAEVTVDLTKEYLSYPMVNEPIKVHFYHVCNDVAGDGYEEHDWDERITITMTVKPEDGVE